MTGANPSVGLFREMMSHFPSGVAVVTCVPRAGARSHGMTCTSLASVCLDPPTLLVSLRTASATCDAVTRSTRFAVNLLEADGRHVAEAFATRGVDRFAAVDWHHSPGGQPWLIDHATASADCRMTDRLDVGDHSVLVGQISALALHGGPPLLYGLRDYIQLATPTTTT
jgi:flavin reductase (DIM6/NTAB) family NADH-FMN oxidoreductase RutF